MKTRRFVLHQASIKVIPLVLSSSISFYSYSSSCSSSSLSYPVLLWPSHPFPHQSFQKLLHYPPWVLVRPLSLEMQRNFLGRLLCGCQVLRCRLTLGRRYRDPGAKLAWPRGSYAAGCLLASNAESWSAMRALMIVVVAASRAGSRGSGWPAGACGTGSVVGGRLI